jgi:hypothetical protein
MAQDLIRYDLLVQDALKGVVRRVLSDAAAHGLPGEHHFYISFRTDAPGVEVSHRLIERHPDEMTIVLQHQFWDLIITETSFEVGLSFGGVPERLFVPFDAVTGFWDPAVDFGLKFELSTVESADNDAHDAEFAQSNTPVAMPAKGSRKTPEKEAAPAADPAPAPVEGAETADGSAQIVRLDAFRKKP